MYVEVLPWSTCVPSLVLIAQVVFHLESGHTHAHTQDHRGHCWLASVVNAGNGIMAVTDDQNIDVSIGLRKLTRWNHAH